jgi:hypothetical protein
VYPIYIEHVQNTAWTMTMVDQRNSQQLPAGGRLFGREPVSARFLAGVSFALMYALMQHYAGLSALSVLALLLCVLHRVDERQRKIAQAPLTLSALLLAQKIFMATNMFGVILVGKPWTTSGQLAAPWLPLFLAVPLFYLPEGISHSRKVLLGLGLAVLCSGLLPDNGFAAVFFTLPYVLFFVVVGALLLDFFSSPQSKTVPSH